MLPLPTERTGVPSPMVKFRGRVEPPGTSWCCPLGFSMATASLRPELARGFVGPDGPHHSTAGVSSAAYRVIEFSQSHSCSSPLVVDVNTPKSRHRHCWKQKAHPTPGVSVMIRCGPQRDQPLSDLLVVGLALPLFQRPTRERPAPWLQSARGLFRKVTE